ncbi:MAG: acyl-CoA dehydrogenase family protein [Saprospiraceae bacterium]|nr:acyl-CoA dehydrogenase family protein [Saprospiraceae bacterium]MBK7812234.1 acyl-CoA dehydrogenase family protein [Saprospiraceae bacterium]MBK9632546.1 acyl-CoA dehydrogenase family protein [Saprospiraceae bacterium]
MSTKTEEKVLKGGEFIILETDFKSNFIPEDLNEDQKMIRSMVRDFVESEIRHRGHKLEEQVSLLEQAASLGLLGAHIPEEFGGMALDTHSNTLISEELGRGDASFNTSIAAHTGIGMLPILYFGTEEQKHKYLPGLSNGTLKACYCLTEPGSGSDALSAKTKADLDIDGEHYILNGQKMWISNAGFADVFIVFAQIDGNKFTGFIVDKGTDGLVLGAEEHKLGIKGSSTRQVFFENLKIHKTQILGQIGKGHLIAFNVLNIGRYKLGTMAMGGCKRSIDEMVKYANTRIQFDHPISSYGAIQYKIAESIVRVVVLESTVYRVSDLMEDKKSQETAMGTGYAAAMLKAAEEYAVECAIIKINGSEVLDYVVDEMLQCFGGYGFSEEYLPARIYRDARINRIYEGTNEINRMLAINMILKRALKGELDLVGPAWAVQKELTGMPSMEIPDGPYGLELRSIREFKKTLLMVAGAAVKYQMDGKHDLKDQQEILMNIADIAIDAYNTESIYLRLMKLRDKGETNLELFEAAMRIFIWDAQTRIIKNAQDALASFAEGDELRIMLLGVKRFSRYDAPNVKNLRRMIALKAIEVNGYCF